MTDIIKTILFVILSLNTIYAFEKNKTFNLLTINTINLLSLIAMIFIHYDLPHKTISQFYNSEILLPIYC